MQRVAASKSDSGERVSAYWLAKDYFADNDLNFLAVIDYSDTVLVSEWYDSALGEFTAVPQVLTDALQRGAFLPKPGKFARPGIFMVDGKPLWIAAQTILRSGESADTGKVLILGQLAGQELVRSLRNAFGIYASFQPFDSAGVPPEIASRTYAFSYSPYEVVVLDKENSVASAVVFPDVEGKPAEVLSVGPDIDWNKTVGTASLRFRVFAVAVILLAGLVVVIFLECLVFRPLISLRRLVSAIANNPEGTAPAVSTEGIFGEIGDDLSRILVKSRANSTTLRRRTEDLQYRIKTKDAIGQVSMHLLRAEDDSAIKSLRALASKLDLDFVAYFQILPERDSMRFFGVFKDPVTGEHTGQYDFVVPAADWVIRSVRHNQNLVLNNARDIPEGMADAGDFLAELELKSFLGVPLAFSGGRLGGMLAFGSLRAYREWNDEDLAVLEMVAMLFAEAQAWNRSGPA